MDSNDCHTEIDKFTIFNPSDIKFYIKWAKFATQ